LNISDMRSEHPSGGPDPASGEGAGSCALRIGFLLTDKFTLTAFAGLIDALRLAADPGGRSRQIHAAWQVMSPGGKPVRSSCGLAVEPGELTDPGAFDYIAVCGGNDYLNERQPAAVLDYIRLAVERRVRLLGICTGTFAIAQADVVGSRRVCVHWNVLDAFRDQFPALKPVVDSLFIDEGDLVTCAGSTAAIDLGLYLIARHCGGDKARQAVRHMMLQGMRPGFLPQAHFYADLGEIDDVRVRQAAHFIEQRLDDPPSIEAIARYVGISGRQLERDFRRVLGLSPAAFHRKLRLEYGKRLLTTSARTITEIALDCGFADGAHFSREFRAQFKEAPSRYRAGAQAG
jgi:transcriptional regulator GlxA family with amidase domain